MNIFSYDYVAILLGCFVLATIALLLYRKEKKNSNALIEKLEEERVENKKYIDELDNLLSMLAHFQEIGMKYADIEDIKDICNLIVEYATDLLDTKMGSLMLINKNTNLLEIVAARGLSKEVVKATKIHMGEGIAGVVAREGKSIYCEDIDNDVRFMRHTRVKYTSKSFIAVPLKIKNKVIGVINVNSKRKRQQFNERDVKLLDILADQAAVAIDNIQLYKNMKGMYVGTIKMLAKAIDAKDPFTKGHSERVTEFAVEIAKEMQLPEKLIRNVEFAALIHDIGKIGVKDSVLAKPSRLSDSEYEMIKKHPVIGEQIIAPIEFLTNIAPLVLYHHEHFDGSGYLEGLKGDEIPIGARILIVADSFEAMISDRPYSKSMTQKQAIQELKDNSGSQFDPQVVEAFLRVIERKKQTKSNESDVEEEKKPQQESAS
jgi:HD-GYP domain-containing protein (c-di-GMP phosphodiesterase class II)